MHKLQKQQIIDIIQSLHILHGEIKKALDAGEHETVKSLLADCQEAAIQVGEVIEQTEGQETEAVGCLEVYCEGIYQVSVQVQEISSQKANKLLDKYLLKAENEIKRLEIKKTVFFLPYKASMWDSMESVWRAASQEKDWESFVMPIPYYSKNEDGTLGEMQYEGADFPDYVSVVDWQKYSLEEEHPDIIFIHNPYDQYNYVTTVHPYFYASRIWNYTDKLVYIPYFVHQNDQVADYYCVLPGVHYADVVILQSEKVREQYIKYYEEAFPEPIDEQKKREIEQKFMALGSPKFDVADIEESDIPEEWREFLGEDKKVIFFNTHLSGLMKGNSEQFLKKLEWVFNLFKGRDDITLLWRPHPLMLETARSMNPEAVDPYLLLVDKYKEQKIGIYDDSKDLHRAINLSDAYYGNASSVVELFKNQGKPVMLMNEQIVEG